MSKSLFCTQPISRTNFLATCRCFSVHSSFVFFHSRAEPAPAKCPPSILHIHASLPTFSNGFILACCRRMFFTSCGQTSLISTPSVACSCKSCYLPPRLNFLNPFHPSFPLLTIPFSRPDCLCPILCGQVRELLFQLQTKRFPEQRQRSRALCSPLLLPSASSILIILLELSPLHELPKFLLAP